MTTGKDKRVILHLVRHTRPEIDPAICYGHLDMAASHIEHAADNLRRQLPANLPVWSSPLRRCLALARVLSPQPTTDDRLTEMNFGHWEGQRWDDVPRDELDAWAADIAGYAPPGGESPRALQMRAVAFVQSLAVPEAIIVTHAGVIRTLIAHWHNIRPSQWSSIEVPYGSCTRVSIPQ